MSWDQEAIEEVTRRPREPRVALASDATLPLDAVGSVDRATKDVARRGRLRTPLKRAFDIAFSLVALLLLFPVWLAFALAIRLDTPGPILFRQRRIGRNGVEFGMFKFRTMVDGADLGKDEIRHLNEAAEGLFKIRRDPRVTRFGSFLRATSLDEAPQLINVLIGQMSLVGPRPLVPEEDARIDGRYRARLGVRPGMTGPWQVAGASTIPIREMVKLDLAYVQGWTLLGDLGLIVRTVPHVLLRRGV